MTARAYLLRLVERFSGIADNRVFPLFCLALAFAATLLAVAFVPVLFALVSLKRKHWMRTAAVCAMGSALGAMVMSWLVVEYGTQAMVEIFPAIARSREWTVGLRWVDQFGFIALIAFAALPVSQTPVLIACALLGMSPQVVFTSVLIGKLLKYGFCAAFTSAALVRVAAH